jgi:hypothetical protein
MLLDGRFDTEIIHRGDIETNRWNLIYNLFLILKFDICLYWEPR